MTLNILGDVKAPMNLPVSFIPEASAAYNAAVESYKDSAKGDTPATSVLEATAVRDTLALLDIDPDQGFESAEELEAQALSIELRETVSWAESLEDEVLGLEGPHAVVVLETFERMVTILQNERRWYVHQCKEYALAEGSADVSTGDYEAFKSAKDQILASFAVAGFVDAEVLKNGKPVKVLEDPKDKDSRVLKAIEALAQRNPEVFKKNDDESLNLEALDLRNTPQGLKPAKDGAAATGKRGKPALAQIVSFTIDEQEIPKGTSVMEILARYLPDVSFETWNKAFDNLRAETKGEDTWTRMLRVPGHDVTVTKEAKK